MSYDTMPPCKENKCILYPICLGKAKVECEILADFYGMASDGTYDSGSEIWGVIQDVLPNLEEIHGPFIVKNGLSFRTFTICKYPDPGYFNPGD